MKRLLIAAAAFALMGSGAAMAQQQPSNPNWDGAHGAATGGTLPQPAPGAQDAANSAAMGGSTMSANGSSTAIATNTGATVGDETASNPAPTSYPRCTHKGQDRCRTKGG